MTLNQAHAAAYAELTVVTGAAANGVLSSAGELSRNAELLRLQVDNFLREVLAA